MLRQHRQSPRIRHDRRAFTLVELVVVVMILAIIAGIASPTMFDAAGDARDSGTHQSLVVVRNAVQLHRAQVGALPGDLGTEADLKADLAPFMSGGFPRAEVGNVGDTIRIQATGAALAASGTESWAYDNVSGQFIVNDAAYATW